MSLYKGKRRFLSETKKKEKEDNYEKFIISHLRESMTEHEKKATRNRLLRLSFYYNRGLTKASKISNVQEKHEEEAKRVVNKLTKKRQTQNQNQSIKHLYNPTRVPNIRRPKTVVSRPIYGRRPKTAVPPPIYGQRKTNTLRKF